MDLHVADLLGLEVFAYVDFVFEGEDQFAHAAAFGGQDLLLDAAHRKRLAGEGDFSGRTGQTACASSSSVNAALASGVTSKPAS